MTLSIWIYDSFERFDEINLANKEDFYSELNDKHICDNIYVHALKSWNEFRVPLLL